jgi:single-strand DNA-binding protein
MGNLTRDPEQREMPSGMKVSTFGIAVNERWTGKDGEKREDVMFLDVDVFGSQGEVIMQYFSKGKPILVEGKLKYRTWESDDGSKRSKHSMVLDRFSFVGGRGSDNGAAATDDDIPF